jgi:MFS family permease
MDGGEAGAAKGATVSAARAGGEREGRERREGPWGWFGARVPFDPRRVRFFYGWVILAAGSFAMVAAAPVAPPGMSPFVDPMLAALALGRGEFSLAYLLGTLVAGVATLCLGGWIDRVGVRRICTASFVLLGVSLALLGLIDRWLTEVAAWRVTLVLAAVFAGARLFGLGVVMTAVRIMLVRWFVRRRNFAVAVSGAVVSLCFSAAPTVFLFAVEGLGWRQTWWVLGGLFATVFAAVAWVFFRDSPEEVGLGSDETLPERAGRARRPAPPDGPDVAARVAFRTGVFYVFTGGIVLNCLLGTGVSFNLASIGAEQGLAKSVALALFVPSALVNLAVTAWFGTVGARSEPRWLLRTLTVGLGLDLLGLFHLAEAWGRVVFVLGSGTAWACFGLLLSTPWPRYFGRAELGRISGAVSGTMIVSTATGPFLFGACLEHLGSYRPAFGLIAGLLALYLWPAWRVRRAPGAGSGAPPAAG